MIRIAITEAAFDTIAATPSLGSVGESYSDVILRIAAQK